MVYEYTCKRCDETAVFNISVAEYENLLPHCEKCGSMDLVRKWSAPSIHVDHAE